MTSSANARTLGMETPLANEIAEEDATPTTDKNWPLSPSDRGALKKVGLLVCLSDVIWVAQAGIIAWVAAGLLHYGLAGEHVASEGFEIGVADLTYAAIGFCLLAYVRAWLQWASAKQASDVARSAKQRIRKEFLNTITSTSPAAPMPDSGTVSVHLAEHVDALGPYISRFYPQMFRVKVVPLVILACIVPFSWLAAVILLVCGPIIPFFMALIGMRAKAASSRQQEEMASLGSTLLDRVRGLETLRLFGALQRTVDDVEASGERFRRGTMQVLRIAFLSSTVLELFSALGIAFVAVYVGFSLLGDISIGTWSAPLGYFSGLFILLLVPEFFAPLRSYALAYHDRAAGLAASEKLRGLMEGLAGASGHPALETKLSSPASNSSSNEQSAGGLSAPHIQVTGLSFAHGAKPVLDNVCFDLPAGQTLVITGESGAGKTTLLDCLLAFHTPDAGLISVDGTDLRSLDNDKWRQLLAWLGQAPRLFHGSLQANLRLAKSDASQDEMQAALELAGAGQLLARLPAGLKTQLGDDGFGLSVGEARRVALARAALRTDAKLFLADEPTAGLDAETASDVISGLRELGKTRTMLIVTHDPKLLDLADQHIVLTRSTA
ncbi:ABC transporter, CydDC-E family, permease/ATP-binding protein CydD [Roseibium sp. TrichSKD4]|nr:ABC transporter, CydDC-E family, permease/ATP-binding protein CydD [Roseibium sp. TrichSKD4]